MRKNSKDPADWNEFDWERALRESDDYAARYFGLLRRFCDLPGSDALIADRLEHDFSEHFPDCDLNCESCSHRWECEFAAVQDWDPSGVGDLDEMDDSDANETDQEAQGPPQPGDPMFYESQSAFVLLRQSAIGWCNVYAAVLPQESRHAGMRALFHFGRALAYLADSIGDGLFDQPAGCVAFAKRCLDQLNSTLGIIEQMRQEKPRLRNILKVVHTHLLKVREAVWDHLTSCREKLDATPPGTETP